MVIAMLFLFIVLRPLHSLYSLSLPTNYFKKGDMNQHALITWWKNNPKAPRGLSCDDGDESERSALNDNIKDVTFGGAIFNARTPVPSSTGEKRQLALVVPFVDFQMGKLQVVLRKQWMKHPPCKEDDGELDADLVFITPVELSNENKKAIKVSERCNVVIENC